MAIIIDSAPAPAEVTTPVGQPDTFRLFMIILLIVVSIYTLGRNPDLLSGTRAVTSVSAFSSVQMVVTEYQLQHMVLAALAQSNTPMLTAPVVNVNNSGIVISAYEGMLVFTPAVVNGSFGLRLSAINLSNRLSTDPQVAMLNENLGNSIAYALGEGRLPSQVHHVSIGEHGIIVEFSR